MDDLSNVEVEAWLPAGLEAVDPNADGGLTQEQSGGGGPSYGGGGGISYGGGGGGGGGGVSFGRGFGRGGATDGGGYAGNACHLLLAVRGERRNQNPRRVGNSALMINGKVFRASEGEGPPTEGATQVSRAIWSC